MMDDDKIWLFTLKSNSEKFYFYMKDDYTYFDSNIHTSIGISLYDLLSNLEIGMENKFWSLELNTELFGDNEI